MMTTQNVTRLPLPQGTRVRIVAGHRPPPPHDVGIIWEHHPEHGGYLVQHDSSPFAEDGLPGTGHRLFGWSYDEVQPEAQSFLVGDTVTRTGTDRHIVRGVWPPPPELPLQLDVECIRAPDPDEDGSTWCAVGDREENLARRYRRVVSDA